MHVLTLNKCCGSTKQLEVNYLWILNKVYFRSFQTLSFFVGFVEVLFLTLYGYMTVSCMICAMLGLLHGLFILHKNKFQSSSTS